MAGGLVIRGKGKKKPEEHVCYLKLVGSLGARSPVFSNYFK
jgi:hypothetical protein